jgi:hypothetical protein
VAALFVMATPALAADGAPKVHLGELRLHVFYRDSGQLSSDLLQGDGPRATLNLVIGGGELEGPADHALVVLPVVADDASGDAQVFAETPIAILVRNRAGKVIARRTITGVLTSHEGRAFEPLWLPDATCDGPLAIEATMANQRVTANFDFNCGE